MRHLPFLFAVLALLGLDSPAAAVDDMLGRSFEDIPEYCEQVFPDSYVMQEACRKRELEASIVIEDYCVLHDLCMTVDELDARAAAGSPHARILANCMRVFATSGFTMLAACVQRETAAYERLHGR